MSTVTIRTRALCTVSIGTCSMQHTDCTHGTQMCANIYFKLHHCSSGPACACACSGCVRLCACVREVATKVVGYKKTESSTIDCAMCTVTIRTWSMQHTYGTHGTLMCASKLILIFITALPNLRVRVHVLGACVCCARGL